VTPNKPYDITKQPTPVRNVIINRDTLHPNDRARSIQHPVNDPGAYRAIVRGETGNATETGRPDSVNEFATNQVVGLVYHPEGDPRGLRRAPLEPIDRRGRQIVRRHNDDHDRPQRASSWPPRDLDAEELGKIEARYQKREPRRRR